MRVLYPRTFLLAFVLVGCAGGAAPPGDLPRLAAERRVLTAGGKPFVWRFVTGFRLVDYVADGQEEKATAFLDWAARAGFKGVRVLSTLCCWFDLRPEPGRAALPRLLTLAADRGLYVEVVALAGTREQSLTRDAIRAHVAGVGRIAAAHSNAVIELANENAHQTQVSDLQDGLFLRELRSLIPREVPVSLGSNCCGEAESPDQYPAALRGGDYLTVHTTRETNSNDRVARLADLRRLSAATGRYVVADEPIGAAERTEVGRRSADPAAFLAESSAALQLGIGMTFHCEDCLQANVPGPVQQKCAEAFIRGSRFR